STEVELDAVNVIQNVTVLGGCNGNLNGISILLQGMNANEAIAKLKDVKCGRKNTSCPAQIAACLAEAVENNK
ncbi:MAG: TIGR03905 family TSCPD domain-containing protein, partial [Oscillospiraceae bacterium]